MKAGKISVITPCYNQGQYLPETLESLLNQTYTDWECIVVNDGSTDNTDEVARKYVEIDSRFRYLTQKNQGQAIARNNAISVAEGEWLLPLDSDDILAPTYLEKCMDWLNQHPETKLVYSKADFFGKRKGPWILDDYDYEKFIWRNCIPAAAVFRKADYDKTKGYNPNMKNRFEDWDFWLSLLNEKDKVHCIDEILYHYRKKSTSLLTDSLELHKEEALVQLYHNHKEIYAPYLAYCQERVVFYHDESPEKVRTELRQIRSSHAYRLGKILLSPLSLIKRLL